MRAMLNDGAMAFVGIAGPVCREVVDFFILGDPVEWIGHDLSIADMVSRDPDGANLESLHVDPKVDIALGSPLWPAMIERVSFASGFGIDPRAVDRKVQWHRGAASRDVPGQDLLAKRQRTQKAGAG